jgi:hypothetical protein
MRLLKGRSGMEETKSLRYDIVVDCLHVVDY